MTTWYLRANSTARICSTPAPELDNSSMSSYEMTSSFLARGHTRGSAVYTPSTSE